MTDKRIGIGGNRHQRRGEVRAGEVPDADRRLHADARVAVAKGEHEKTRVYAIKLVIAVGERAEGKLAQLGKRGERRQSRVRIFTVELLEREERRDADVQLAALHCQRR